MQAYQSVDIGSYDYTITQVALYKYYNTWVNAIGTDKGFSTHTNDTTASEMVDGIAKNEAADSYINEIKTKVSNGTAYNAKIYYLDCFQADTTNLPGGNSYNFNYGSYVQKTIIVETDPLIDIPVKKVWSDSSNANGNRPSSITVKLYANEDEVDELTLSGNGNTWTGTFTDLPPTDDSGNEIIYTISEVSATGYNSKITGNQSNGFTITNTEQTVNKTVNKTWNDDDNRDGKRPNSITVTLYADGVKKATATLPNNGKWSYTFTNLPVYKNKQLITYTVAETAVDGYDVTQETLNNTYQITNTHIPEKIEIPVEKIWDDENDMDEKRPEEIIVTLYANGVTTNKTLTLKEANEWKGTFTDLYKYEDGELIEYTIKELKIEGYEQITIEPSSIKGSTEDGVTTTSGFKITNKHTPYYEGYIEITGNVWLDKPNGKANSINGIKETDETGLGGIKVTLKAADDSQFDETSYAITDDKGNYTIKVNVDTEKEVYKLYQNPDGGDGYESLEERLAGAYIEFEYNANKYTTVKDGVETKINENGEEVPALSSEQSKAIENEKARNNFDETYSTISAGVEQDGVEQKIEKTDTSKCDTATITASTQETISFGEYTDILENQSRTVTLKYSYGDHYVRTNPEGAWKDILEGTHTLTNSTEGILLQDEVLVKVIQNVNLGLFEREQPTVAIYAELEEVNVSINQNVYKYDYTKSKTADSEKTYQEVYEKAINEGKSEEVAKLEAMKAKFQNNETYTYRKPVNPADIAYGIATEDFYVDVTYSFYIGNGSSTLDIEVDYIINTFDSRYEILDTNWVNYEDETYNNSLDPKYSKAINTEPLNIKLGSGESSEYIYITYKVGVEALKDLFDEETTVLNNAMEIHTYTTTYGEKTLYAEQQSGDRAGKLYGGYDKESKPGNAELEEEQIVDEKNENKTITILKDRTEEDDTDIAPSFVLCYDGYRQVTGTVWEDSQTEESAAYNERLGNGLRDATENVMENIKVELYNTDGFIAQLYGKKIELSNPDDPNSLEYKVYAIPAETYTKENGTYSFVVEQDGVTYGIIPGNYYIKYTYGNADETNITKINSVDENGVVTNIVEKVNGRNYKSTIISEDTNSKIYDLFYEKEFDIHTDEANLNWPLTIENIEGIESIAIDNMEDRMKITDLTYDTSDDSYNITANSKEFHIGIEFDTDNESGDGKVDIYGVIDGIDKQLDVFNFGIIERPRERFIVSNTVSNIAITLANGQNLINGNPNDNLPYVKSINNKPYDKDDDKSDANPSSRIVTAELDSELMQGAKMYVTYDISVTNECEIDYDYYDGEVDDTNEYDTEKVKTGYYYYGEKIKKETGEDDYIGTTVKYLTDYLTPGFTRETKENDIWEKVPANDLYGEGLISEVVQEKLILDKKTTEDDYQVFRTDAFKDLAYGESRTVTMEVSQGLTNKTNKETTIYYDNYAEILKVDAKISRSASGENDKVVYKETTPGNYVPGSSEKEIDDDGIDAVPTTPTGIGTNITTYIIIGLVGLIIIGVGVIIIKKKVLN